MSCRVALSMVALALQAFWVSSCCTPPVPEWDDEERTWSVENRLSPANALLQDAELPMGAFDLAPVDEQRLFSAAEEYRPTGVRFTFTPLLTPADTRIWLGASYRLAESGRIVEGTIELAEFGLLRYTTNRARAAILSGQVPTAVLMPMGARLAETLPFTARHHRTHYGFGNEFTATFNIEAALWPPNTGVDIHIRIREATVVVHLPTASILTSGLVGNGADDQPAAPRVSYGDESGSEEAASAPFLNLQWESAAVTYATGDSPDEFQMTFLREAPGLVRVTIVGQEQVWGHGMPPVAATISGWKPGSPGSSWNHLARYEGNTKGARLYCCRFTTTERTHHFAMPANGKTAFLAIPPKLLGLE